jgi:hypothetical protein
VAPAKSTCPICTLSLNLVIYILPSNDCTKIRADLGLRVTFNYVSDTNINAVCVIDLCFNYPSFIINPWATLSMYLEDYKMLYFTTFIMYWNQYPDIDSESTGQYHGCRFSLSIPNPLVSLYNRWREEYRLPDWGIYICIRDVIKCVWHNRQKAKQKTNKQNKPGLKRWVLALPFVFILLQFI